MASPEENVERIKKLLADMNPGPECPLCKAKSWAIKPKLGLIEIGEAVKDFSLAGANAKVVTPLRCGGCGLMLLLEGSGA
ncbi:unnamed protein product [marine sediment metagenome]|uniref:Uncharacterized protein n=1 Tax=marine sediment metagenome TaxID=412755 RepID=X0VT44_9ZZZZ